MIYKKKELDGNAIVYKPNQPYQTSVISKKLLSMPGSLDEICHLEFDCSDGQYQFIEGQSMGLVPQGLDDRGKPHKLRLYSICSSSKGDDGLSRSLSICVKRVAYKDPTSGQIIKGVASNDICDLEPGDKLAITGPTGKAFVMPVETSSNMILIATGTGIAPFRSFLQAMFRDSQNWSGKVLLFYGAKMFSELVYANDNNTDLKSYENFENFQMHQALSREVFAADGSKIYVQDLLKNHAEQIASLMALDNTFVYICGLKGMEKGIMEAMQAITKLSDQDWKKAHNEMKKEGRWNQEVY